MVKMPAVSCQTNHEQSCSNSENEGDDFTIAYFSQRFCDRRVFFTRLILEIVVCFAFVVYFLSKYFV